jgi:hypothetical protein
MGSWNTDRRYDTLVLRAVELNSRRLAGTIAGCNRVKRKGMRKKWCIV